MSRGRTVAISTVFWDAGALPIADEAKLHLGDHAQHGQHHAAHRPAGIDGRLQHPEAFALFLQFAHEIEDDDEDIAGANFGTSPG